MKGLSIINNHQPSLPAKNKNSCWRYWAGLLGVILLASNGAARADDTDTPLIAIIIDDIGNQRPEGLRAVSLPGPLTYAILPHTPYARFFAERAHASNKEILLHLPMESTKGLPLGPGGITADMTQPETIATVNADIGAVPHARGINNHMGSLLSARGEHVSWLMKLLGEQHSQLFFVDSRTTPDSILLEAANQQGVPIITRDVFLDHSPDPAEIAYQFDRLLARARANGTALAIGHARPNTLKMLASQLPHLAARGIRLVGVSELLAHRQKEHAYEQLSMGLTKRLLPSLGSSP